MMPQYKARNTKASKQPFREPNRDRATKKCCSALNGDGCSDALSFHHILRGLEMVCKFGETHIHICTGIQSKLEGKLHFMGYVVSTQKGKILSYEYLV